MKWPMTLVLIMMVALLLSALIPILATLYKVLTGDIRDKGRTIDLPGVSLRRLIRDRGFVRALRVRAFFWESLNAHLARRVLSDIIVHEPAGRVTAPLSDGRFHIHFFSSPQATEKRRVPYLRFGKLRSSSRTGFAPSGRVAVATDDCGFEIAEFVAPNNLYVLVDVGATFDDIDQQFVRVLFERAQALLELDEDELRQRQVRLQEERRAKSRENLTREVAGATLAAQVAESKERNARAAQRVQALLAAIGSTSRGAVEDEADAVTLARLVSQHEGQAQTEYDAIARVAKVKSYDIVGDTLEVFTETLYCLNPSSGQKHEIGAFRIEVSLDGLEGGVRWFNLTRQTDAMHEGMQAPYVYHNGDAQIGQVQGLFPVLIGERKFAQLVRLAIRYIEQVNPVDAAAKYLHCWPLEGASASN